MKIFFAVSVMLALVVGYLFQSNISIHDSNTSIQNQNPLRDAQVTLTKVQQSPLDFTLLNQPYSQDSLDTEIAGLIRADENDNVIVDSELKDFIDYFLSSVGQITPEQALQRMRLHIYQQLPQQAAEQAMAILSNYLAFKEASFDALSASVDSARTENDAHYRFEKLQQGLQTLHDLRRTHLGHDVADNLFYEDEAYAKYTLANMAADLDDSLTNPERQQLRELARAELPEEMAEILRQQEHEAKVMQAYNDQLMDSPTVEAFTEFAYNHFESEQAERIVSDYEQQWQLKQKFDQFSAAQLEILSQELDSESKKVAIEHLASQYFSAEEYTMVQAWQMAKQEY